MTSEFNYSSTNGSGSTGVSMVDVQNVFMEELGKIGTRPQELNNAVIMRQQSNAKEVKQKVEHAAQSADQRVRDELGVPEKLSSGITMLKIIVTYTNVDDEKVTLPYTYKE